MTSATQRRSAAAMKAARTRARLRAARGGLSCTGCGGARDHNEPRCRACRTADRARQRDMRVSREVRALFAAAGYGPQIEPIHDLPPFLSPRRHPRVAGSPEPVDATEA